MFPPFEENQSFEKCKELINLLNHGNLVIENVSQISEERADHGVMIGVLLCTDKKGNEVQLNTISGIRKKLCLGE